MKKKIGFSVLVAAAVLMGCAQKAKTESPVVESTPPSATVPIDRAQIIADRERELGKLEGRLNRLSETTHGPKLAAGREARATLNADYKRLGEAKSQLKQLQQATTMREFATLQEGLDRTILGLQSRLD